MRITEATKADLPEILAVQKVAFYDVARFYRNFRLKPLLATLDDIDRTFARYTYLKAVNGERIVGSARAMLDGRICKIENVIVHPDFQNEGIGKALMLAIEKCFPDCDYYELFTGKQSTKSVAFYAKLGYVVSETIDAAGLEPELVIMRKAPSVVG